MGSPQGYPSSGRTNQPCTRQPAVALLGTAARWDNDGMAMHRIIVPHWRTPASRRMLLACAAIACCILAEAALRWPAVNFHTSYLLIPLLALGTLPMLAIMPQTGAWLVTTVYCVGLVSPFPMSYSYTLAMVAAVAVIWRDGRAMALLAALLGLSALLVDQKVLFGLGLSDSVVVSFAYCMFAVVIGMISRWQADRARQAERDRREAERDGIARALHDRISNDLDYAIMRIAGYIAGCAAPHDDAADGFPPNTTANDEAGTRSPAPAASLPVHPITVQDLADPSGSGVFDISVASAVSGTATYRTVTVDELRELRGIIEQALDDTHQVIDALDGDPDAVARHGGHAVSQPSARPHLAAAGTLPDPSADAAEALIDRIDTHEERLRALGFDGQTTLAAHLPALSKTGSELLADLLGETYANIAKHGDPAHGYVVSIAGDGDDVIVTTADTPLGGGRSGLGLGSGLDRYRRMGVDIRTSGDDSSGQWAMTARIPAGIQPV